MCGFTNGELQSYALHIYSGIGLLRALPPICYGRGQWDARAIGIHVNSGSPCNRLVVFSSIAMATTIHKRCEERNLYRVLVWKIVLNFFWLLTLAIPRLEQGLILPEGQPRLVEPTPSPGKKSPLELVFSSWAPCPGAVNQWNSP
ncbi:unnamed protein product [Prunus armeniaca]